MKKIISILLCLATVFSAVALLSSCKKEGITEPKVSKKTVEVDLSEYSVVADMELSTGTQNRINLMTTQLSSLSGLAMRILRDQESEPVETEDLEILVGNVNRTEVKKTVKKLGDSGWAIRVTDNKIVLAGTDAFMTRAAISYFMENYITADYVKGTKLTIPKEVTFAKAGSTTFTDEEGMGKYALVYDDSVDDVNNGGSYNYGADQNPSGGAAVDLIFSLASGIQQTLFKYTDAGKGSYPFKVASSNVETENEILIGAMKRDDYREELNKLEANQYGLVIRNGKIMILAWNDTTLSLANTIFEDMLADCFVAGENGEINQRIPANCTIIETATNLWNVDFPKPDGLTLDGTVDVGDNSVMYVYTGADANAYTAYCGKLESDGFTVLGTPTHNLYGTQNMFSDYVNEEKGLSVHVAYTPYEYAAQQGVKDCLASLRVIATVMEDNVVSAPDAEMLNPNQTWTKRTDSMVTAMKHDYGVGSWGVSYVITLEDGSFLIFDGGAGMGFDNADHIFNILKNLYAKAYGEDAVPSAQNPIRIRAWLLTHEHMDHYTVMKGFLDKYAARSDVKVERVIFNATSESQCFNSNNPDSSIRKNISSLQTKGGFKYIKPHTGQIFYFANCKVEIIGTHEDLYPKNLYFFNDSSTTFRTYLKSGNTETDCIWYGDLERMGSRRLRGMWGEHLKTDAVQVAHHGGNGVEKEIYELNAPKIVFMPNKSERVTSSINWANNQYYQNRALYYICHANPNREIIVSSQTKDYTIIFTEAGPQYDKIFDASEPSGAPLDLENISDSSLVYFGNQ